MYKKLFIIISLALPISAFAQSKNMDKQQLITSDTQVVKINSKTGGTTSKDSVPVQEIGTPRRNCKKNNGVHQEKAINKFLIMGTISNNSNSVISLTNFLA